MGGGGEMMKRARVAFGGAIHDAVEAEGLVQLNDGRLLDEKDVVWLPRYSRKPYSLSV